MAKRQKIYVYVDESGQDDSSKFFIVAAVIAEGDQEMLRQQLERIEHTAGTRHKKWHKLRSENRLRYLRMVVDEEIASGGVYIAHYKKPIPFFFPLFSLLEKAIND